MWKNYASDHRKNNRAYGVSVMASSLIAALLLSFLCCLFYNFWLDSIEGTKLEDGDWHGRITGEIDEDGLDSVNYFANVEQAVVNQELSGEQGMVVDVYFYNKRTVYQDMSALVKLLGLEETAVDYNYQLLSLYLIRIPGDDKPRLLLPAYLAVVAMVCFSLVLVIHNSFAVSMNNRIRQFGIFSSIGATPRQIRICLVQEAFALAVLPMMAGILIGVVLSSGTIWAMGVFAADFIGGRQISFDCHPFLLVFILFLSMLTVLVSAWLPARKLSRLTPLAAIRGTGEPQLKTKYRCPVISMLFGIEGEIAAHALKAQNKSLRTTSLSLTLAFFSFMMVQCFFTLSGISTNHTYFEKYQDAWDVMATVKDTPIEDFALAKELQSLPGADSGVVYQKAEAVCRLPREAQSEELLALGGLDTLSGDLVFPSGDSFSIKTSLIILDDKSFREFCKQAGAEPRLDGTIVWNCLWDSLHSNFRYPQYIPYLKEDMETITLNHAVVNKNAAPGAAVRIPVLACTQEYPLLREELGKVGYPLVQFLPLSLWKDLKGQIGGADKDTYVRVLANDRENLDALQMLEEELLRMIGPEYQAESENRIQERQDNDQMIAGYERILGAFSVLFAVIGIAHVFSHTFGFLRIRKREFARLLSVGLTPAGIWKMFCAETLVIVGRPMLLTLGLTTVAVAVMLKASCLDPTEFIKAAPAAPIMAFLLAVFAFVALAYYLGGRRIRKVSLADALRDDTMM